MVEIESGLRENTVGMVEQFAAIASVDPLVAAMMLSGALITGLAVTAFGVATVGGIAAAITQGLSGSEEPNQPA